MSHLSTDRPSCSNIYTLIQLIPYRPHFTSATFSYHFRVTEYTLERSGQKKRWNSGEKNKIIQKTTLKWPLWWHNTANTAFSLLWSEHKYITWEWGWMLCCTPPLVWCTVDSIFPVLSSTGISIVFSSGWGEPACTIKRVNSLSALSADELNGSSFLSKLTCPVV